MIPGFIQYCEPFLIKIGIRAPFVKANGSIAAIGFFDSADIGSRASGLDPGVTLGRSFAGGGEGG
jgi:hypothetical protein